MLDNNNTYSISELSSEFDITTRTIRFYEAEKLIVPKRQGQKRIYSEANRVKIKLILRGKRLGLSLKEIKEILSLYDPKTANKKQLTLLLNKLEKRRAALEQQAKDINDMLNELNDVEKSINQALKQTQ